MISSPLRQSYQSGMDASLLESDENRQTSLDLRGEELMASLEAANNLQRTPTAIIANAGQSSVESTPESLPTPQATEHVSSADDSDRGPLTPKPEDDFRRDTAVEGEKGSPKGLKIEPTHIEPTTISVA